MPAARVVPTATRRTTLVAGGTTLGLVLGGCGDGRAPTGAPGSAPAVPDDDAILTAVRTEVAAAHALVAATASRFRSLQGVLGELQATHAAQLEVLAPEGGVAGAEPEVTRDRAAALARVRANEERLQRRLLTWAVAVESGPLARVLAAAAAGTAQHLVLLERLPSGGGAT